MSTWTVWLGGYTLLWLVIHSMVRILWMPRWTGERRWWSRNTSEDEDMRLNTDNQAIELLLADEEESHSTYTLTQKNTTTLFVDWCRIQWETTKLPSFLYRWASPRVDHRDGSCQAQGWLWWFSIDVVYCIFILL
ncbi:hypothetical protein BDF19DRAFT_225487 [Syncephalis fuscata]|nr:hypothetical protein BDF19DRAFT_426976 [Syncephalis fuscata]KAI9592110.1 hypothetical protein BDF19DRAFT_225487 [Syncephalis fuscata]